MLDYLKDRSILLASVLLLAQTGTYYSIAVKETIPAIAPWSQFSNEINGWQAATDTAIEPEVLAALQPDDYLNRNYISKQRNAVVNLLVVYFATRRSGHAPHSPQWCLPSAGWKDVSSRVVALSMPGETGPQVNEYIVQKGGEMSVVVYWYHQGPHVVANEIAAQMYALPDMMFHGRTDTALVRVIAPVSGDGIDRARDTAFQFARDSFSLIRKQIK